MATTAQNLSKSSNSRARLLFVGFGNVGRALAPMLMRKRGELESQFGIQFAVCGVITARHGWALAPLRDGEDDGYVGIDLQRVVDALAPGSGAGGQSCGVSAGDLSTLADTEAGVEVGSGDSADTDTDAASALDAQASLTLELIRRSGATHVFEAVPVNYSSGEPALSFARAALGMGAHVISANKGPVVHAHDELIALAARHKVRYLFESAVMDGVPIFSLQRAALPGARVLGFEGVLNSTTNIILSGMESGQTYDQALARAQADGIAEADPSGDVDGWDSAVKVAALCCVLLRQRVPVSDVQRTGIRSISSTDVAAAARQGLRYKLLCRGGVVPGGALNGVVEQGQCSVASVQPVCVSSEHPFYQLQGADSAVTIHTDVLQPITITSHHPTNDDTAFGLLADFINTLRSEC
eukprot:g1876.t1